MRYYCGGVGHKDSKASGAATADSGEDVYYEGTDGHVKLEDAEGGFDSDVTDNISDNPSDPGESSDEETGYVY